MIFTITTDKTKTTFKNGDKKEIQLHGYHFIDCFSHCIIMTYGNNRKNDVIKFLTNENNNMSKV